MSKRPVLLLATGFVLVVLGSQGVSGVSLFFRQWDYYSRRAIPGSVLVDFALVLVLGIGVAAALVGARGLRRNERVAEE